MSQSKPRGYWKDSTNIAKALEEIAKKQSIPIEEVVNTTWLKNNGYEKINSAIKRTNGGMPKIRQTLNLKELKKPKNYWNDKSNFDKELQTVIDNLGHFPTNKELKSYGKDIIAQKFKIHYTSRDEARVAHGFDSSKPKIEPYKDWNTLKKTLNEIISKEGHLPGSEALIEKGYGPAVAAMFTYHNGINAVRKKINQELKENPYKTKEKLQQGLQDLWATHPETANTLPSDNKLRELGFSTLGYAVIKYHKGFVAVRDYFDLTKEKINPEKVDKINLKDWSTLVEQIRDIEEKYPDMKGQVLNHEWLIENKYGSIYHAIRKYHGGIYAVRDRLGYNHPHTKPGKWNTLNAILEEVHKLEKTTSLSKEDILKSTWLKKNGYGSMYTAICKNHGGLPAFRETVFEIEEENSTKDLEAFLTQYMEDKE